MAGLKLPTYQEIANASSKAISKMLKKFTPIYYRRLNKIISGGKEGYLKDLTSKMSDADTPTERVAEMVRFLRQPFSKVSKIKQFENKMYRTLRDNGYEIDKKDIPAFNDFMGEVRAMYKGRRIPDSTRVVEAFVQAQRLKLSNKALISNLDYWREHLETLQQLPSSNAKTRYGSKYIKDKVNAIENKKKRLNANRKKVRAL